MSDTIKKFIKEYLPYVVVIILVLIFKANFFSPVKVNGASMDDTLKDKSTLKTKAMQNAAITGEKTETVFEIKPKVSFRLRKAVIIIAPKKIISNIFLMFLELSSIYTFPFKKNRFRPIRPKPILTHFNIKSRFLYLIYRF